MILRGGTAGLYRPTNGVSYGQPRSPSSYGGGGGGQTSNEVYDSSGHLTGSSDTYGGGGNSGGGGGGGGSASAAGGDVNISADVNPMEQEAYNNWKSYNSDLAGATNEEITRELGRARDEISVGMEKEGEAAVGRGADPSLFKSRALESGKRNLVDLQGKLADVALGRREGALQGMTGAAGQAASGQRQLALGTQAARLAEQRYTLDAADQQARLREAPYDRLLKTMSAVSSAGNGFLGTGPSMGFGVSPGYDPASHQFSPYF